MSTPVIVLLAAAIGSVVALELERLRRRRVLAPTHRRILFPFVGQALSEPALEATLRLARAEHAALVPAYLASVPLALPLDAALPNECETALPLLEAIEQRARRRGVVVDARIERGRDPRHALRELMAHERFDRVVVSAASADADGFSAEDIAWLLRNAAGEILVLRTDRPETDAAALVEPPLDDPETATA